MDGNLNQTMTEVYDKYGLNKSNFQFEKESNSYGASRFELNGRKVICRNSKITLKKVGQFVTFWKRSANGIIEPFEETDPIEFYIVNVRTDQEFGQFVFPKSVLINKGILSTTKKEGKRALRVYPKWDIAKNKQAKRAQKWQLDYFYEISDIIALKKIFIHNPCNSRY